MKISNTRISTSNTLVNISTTYFATSDGLMLSLDHIETLSAIQEFYAHHESNKINLRKINDALEEKFHHKGGIKFLYALFPGGPVTQGCQIMGLKPPTGSTDKGFGSAA